MECGQDTHTHRHTHYRQSIGEESISFQDLHERIDVYYASEALKRIEETDEGLIR